MRHFPQRDYAVKVRFEKSDPFPQSKTRAEC
jgi:hypothetical protein